MTRSLNRYMLEKKELPIMPELARRTERLLAVLARLKGEVSPSIPESQNLPDDEEVMKRR